MAQDESLEEIQHDLIASALRMSQASRGKRAPRDRGWKRSFRIRVYELKLFEDLVPSLLKVQIARVQCNSESASSRSSRLTHLMLTIRIILYITSFGNKPITSIQRCVCDNAFILITIFRACRKTGLADTHSPGSILDAVMVPEFR